MQEVTDVLRRLGLIGPYQVHIAPVALVPDERAHQVYLGFTFQQVFDSLKRRLPHQIQATIVAGHGRELTTLGSLAKHSDIPGSIVVLGATRYGSPGGFYGLVQVVDRLLGPGGCPWDQAQTHESLKKYLIEESYELLDAIDLSDPEKMIEELGDVLLQPIMHAQMEALSGEYDIDRVATEITNKLIRRHPHVFGDITVADESEVLKNWDAIKSQEKGHEQSILSGIPRSMPALLRALELSKRAARAGFEWPNIEGVWQKLEEEIIELRAEEPGSKRQTEEIGDVLFTVVNLARWLNIDPEESLHQMLHRFSQRFQAMESMSEKPLKDLNELEWDNLWNQAKLNCSLDS